MNAKLKLVEPTKPAEGSGLSNLQAAIEKSLQPLPLDDEKATPAILHISTKEFLDALDKRALSPWVDKTVPPVRVGVYKVRVIDGDGDPFIGYSHWGGKHFGPIFQSPIFAEIHKSDAILPPMDYRGLAQEAEENEI